MAKINVKSLEMMDAVEGAFKLINFKYKRDDEKLMFGTIVTGDDLEMQFKVVIDKMYERIRIISFLPFKAKQEDYADVCLALNFINNNIIHGRFSMDISDGVIEFEVNSICVGIDATPELVAEMLRIMIHTVDRYNDRLYGLCKKMISLTEFAESFLQDN